MPPRAMSARNANHEDQRLFAQGPEAGPSLPPLSPSRLASGLLDLTTTEGAVPGKTPAQASPSWHCGPAHIS